MTCGCCLQAMDGSRCNIETTAPAWTINGSLAGVWFTGKITAGFWSPVAAESPPNNTRSPVTGWSDWSVSPTNGPTSDDTGRCRCSRGVAWSSTVDECSCLHSHTIITSHYWWRRHKLVSFIMIVTAVTLQGQLSLLLSVSIPFWLSNHKWING